jgi:2-succinyl-5-enolpyruvyl-6-hydroxy-3-cyclohexene-1-carboxylate synthase
VDELQRAFNSVENLLQEAIRRPQGPVHVNLPLVEPLYVSLPQPGLAEKHVTSGSPEPGSGGALSLPPWKTADPRVLILAGMGRGSGEILKALEELAGTGQVAVVAENLSNLASEQFVTVPELVLAGAGPDELKELTPDVVIAFGQQMVSKRMKLFVNALDQAEIMHIPDEVSVTEWLGLLAGSWEKPVENSYQKTWLALQERESMRASGYLNVAPYCNLVAVHRILQKVPGGTVVHLGNSATIRNSQLFPARPGLNYCSNRGTSGIDGSVSAAVGAAMVSPGLHLLLVGDLSFVYDSNALWNKNFPDNLKIVVLNDGGGGIFRLLEGPGDMPFFEEYSVTHHPVSLELLSQSFGRSFHRVDGKEDLDEQLEALFTIGSHLTVLEVDTTSAENSRIFKELFS